MLKGLNNRLPGTRRPSRPRKTKPQASRPTRGYTSTERFTPSSKPAQKAEPSKTTSAKWAMAGATLGLGIAALLFPGAGIAAAVLSAGVGAVSGAVLSSETGTLPSSASSKERFDPFNPNHVRDPRYIFEPNNPLNPIFWDQ